MTHPSELKLERHLLDPARSPIAAHLEGCDRCRDRVAQMRQEGEDFRRFVYPATLDALQAPRFPAFRALRNLWLLAPAAGLAAMLLLVRAGPVNDYIGTKGGPLELTAYAAMTSGAKPLADGDTVSATASLRFRVRSPKTCALSLFSVDQGGQVSRLYTQQVKGDVVLPGGVRLDGKAGLERFFAVCGPDYVTLERAARNLGDGLREKSTLPGVRAPQASLLIEKTP
jgi:hypothetical protein